ncbi:hypothetical protein DY000_02046397 [Brassica cretica]|uniref:PROCN domain-containing protein n=1 Tax=Brassica cretica TaxID=69181 RepID=A0ABQ7EWI2_BRACR|nr:hypothetical protein DY000_02046397 [Brassica cretica]
MRHLPILLRMFSLFPISLLRRNYFISLITSVMLEKLLVFDLLLIPRVSMWAMGLLKLMNGEYLLDHKKFLDVSKLPPYHLQPKYNLAEKLCYEDYLRREILYEDETEERLYETSYEEDDPEGLDETPSFVEVFTEHLAFRAAKMKL